MTLRAHKVKPAFMARRSPLPWDWVTGCQACVLEPGENPESSPRVGHHRVCPTPFSTDPFQRLHSTWVELAAAFAASAVAAECASAPFAGFAAGAFVLSAASSHHLRSVAPGAGVPALASPGVSGVPDSASGLACPAAAGISGPPWRFRYLDEQELRAVEPPKRVLVAGEHCSPGGQPAHYFLGGEHCSPNERPVDCFQDGERCSAGDRPQFRRA